MNREPAEEGRAALFQAPVAVQAVPLPALHSVMLPSTKVEPWGQAQLYPAGLRRQR